MFGEPHNYVDSLEDVGAQLLLHLEGLHVRFCILELGQGCAGKVTVFSVLEGKMNIFL